jgi:hypothetical protein
VTDVTLGDPTLGFAPRVEVPPPDYRPFRYGLFSAAPPVGYGGPKERGGVYADLDPFTPPDAPADGPDAFTYADGCDAASDRSKTIPAGRLIASGDPVTVYGGFRCTPVGASDRDALALKALELGEERALELLLATGTTDNGVSWPVPFASVNVDATSHVALASSFGIAENDLLADYGGLGTILMPLGLLYLLKGFGVVHLAGDHWETEAGTRVAVDRFLTAPALDAAVPVLVAGSLVIRRGEAKLLGDTSESLDRSDNTIVRVAERTYTFLTDFPPA